MDPVISPIIARYHSASAALPKHARLRQAMVAAIEAGDLGVGARVMGERQLSEALGLSLGTTQKALGSLMTEGFLVRRQGLGTFVGQERRPIAATWHFRFLAPEGGAELPVYSSITGRARELESGPWTTALGVDPKGYVRIDRRLDIGGQFNCASQMYLGASRFARLLRIADKRLVDTNLKTVLEREFAAPTLRSEGLATLRLFTPEESAAMTVPRGTSGLQLDIVSRSFGNMPISFQRVLVPPTRCALKLDFNPPAPEGTVQSARERSHAQ